MESNKHPGSSSSIDPIRLLPTKSTKMRAQHIARSAPSGNIGPLSPINLAFLFRKGVGLPGSAA